MFELLSWDEQFLVQTFRDGNLRALCPGDLLAVRPDDGPAVRCLPHVAGEGVGQAGLACRPRLVVVKLLRPLAVNDRDD